MGSEMCIRDSFFIRPQSCDVKKRLARERVGRQASRPAGRHQDSASKATPISGHLEAMPIYARSWSQLDSDLRLLSSSTRFWPRDQPHLSLPPTTSTTTPKYSSATSSLAEEHESREWPWFEKNFKKVFNL